MIIYDKRKIWNKVIWFYFMMSFQHSAEENRQDSQKTGVERNQAPNTKQHDGFYSQAFGEKKWKLKISQEYLVLWFVNLNDAIPLCMYN